MPRVHASHEVKDVNHWLSSPKREEVFGAIGVTEIKTYTDPQGTNRVGLTMNVPDMDAAMAMMQAPEGIAAMEYDGVLPETMVLLIES